MHRFQGARGDALAAAAGLVLPLSFAPFGLFFIAPLSLAVLLLALYGQTPRRGAWRGYLFGLTSFLFGLYWVHISIHDFGGAPLPFALFLMLLLVAFLALYPMLFGYILNRWFSLQKPMFLFCAPAIWVLLEWVRGWMLTGFPWLSLGYSQTDSPLAGFGPVLGVFGLSAFIVTSGSALAALVIKHQHRLVSVLVLLGIWAGGAALKLVDWTLPSDDSFSVALVQGAVPQERKWLPEELQPTIDLYLGLTDRHGPSDLVIWPEAAIPTARHNLTPVFEALQQRAKTSGGSFLLGVVEVAEASGQPLNSVVAVEAGGVGGVYYKSHLVPFGEYFPVPPFMREWLRWMELPYKDFAAGEPGVPPLVVNGRAYGISICYEDVFGEELVSALPEADILVNVTNDAWFGGSLAPHQHLQIARMRAIEVGRQMLRATNNGISAIIDADGKVLGRSPQFLPSVLGGEARVYHGHTPFARWSNWPVVLYALTSLILVLFGRNAE